jgi:hypothetical protein
MTSAGSKTLTALLVVGVLFSLVTLVAGRQGLRLPGNQIGYAPEQPIAFSHRLHAGELQIDCLYCHFGAETSRHAGIPAASVCMNCHQFVTATLGAIRAEDELATEEKRKPIPVVSPELQKIYSALALTDSMTIQESDDAIPIEWIKIHNVPDFVYFDHRAHVTVGVDCQSCHGAVETMERVHQVEDLSMGWCVNCHRRLDRIGIAGVDVSPSIDCGTCHY